MAAIGILIGASSNFPVVWGCDVIASGNGSSAIQIDTSLSGNILFSRLNGETYDINNVGTAANVYGNQYTHAKVNGALTPLAGDRAAYSVEDWHGSDIEASTPTRHNPIGAAIGDLLYWNGTKWIVLTSVAVGSYLRSGGAATAPLWSTLKLPNAASVGDILHATGANSIGNLADVAAGRPLISGGIGVVSAWNLTYLFESTGLTIGSGAAGTDYALTFDGETNDGILKWMEDEDQFKFEDRLQTDGGRVCKITTYNDTCAIATSDEVVVFDKATPFTATIPTGIVGQKFIFKNIGAGNVTLAFPGVDTVDEVDDDAILTQYDSLTLVCRLANKWIKV